VAESRTAVLAALLGNGALTVLKGVSAAATGSAGRPLVARVLAREP
jgi:hypothetical protein